jgi:hypothetical protein
MKTEGFFQGEKQSIEKKKCFPKETSTSTMKYRNFAKKELQRVMERYRKRKITTVCVYSYFT